MKDLISVFLIAISLSLLAGFGGATLHADEVESAEPETLSYIVEGKSFDEASWAVQAVGGKITHELRVINAVAAKLTRAQRERLNNAAGVLRVMRNGEVSTSPVHNDDL